MNTKNFVHGVFNGVITLINAAATWAICRFVIDWDTPLSFINLFWAWFLLGSIVVYIKICWTMYDVPEFKE